MPANLNERPIGPGESRLKLITFDRIEARTTCNALIKGLLDNGTMSVVFGESNCGKSFLTLDLALHIALGWEWRGRKVRQGAVIYVAAEGGHSISNRVAAFKQQHGLSENVPFALVPCSVNLCDPTADTAALIDLIDDAGRQLAGTVVLVVIDTVSRAMAGGNENSPDDMGAYVGNVDRIRERTAAHICNIHHSGKDASKGARGHSLLRAATDTEIEIVKDEAGGFSIAYVRKQRDLPGEGEFPFALDVVELGEDEDGDPVTSCTVRHIDGVAVSRKAKRLTPKSRMALDQLHNAIASCGKPAPASNHIPPNAAAVTLDTWRQWLMERGVLNADGNPRQQFSRIKDALLGAGEIAIWGDHVWSVTSVTFRHSDAA